MRLKVLCLSALLLAGMVAVACRGPATPTPTPGVVTPTPAPPPPGVATPPPTTPVPTPKVAQEGELRVAVPGLLLEALNPILSTISGSNQMLSPIFDHLLGANPDGSLGPGIAERWEMARDGLSWTFHLRKGVKFHNGDDLTAEDVRFSLLAYARKWPGAPLSISSFAGSLEKTIKQIEIADPYTVRVHTDGPNVYFPYLVSPLQASEGMVMPKKHIEKVGWDEFTKKPIGSGPWRFLDQMVGSYVKYEAVAEHWRNTPIFKRYTLLVVPEESTRIALLRVGQADIIEMSAEGKKDVLRAGMRTESVANALQAGVPLYGTYLPGVADKPGANPKVRQALSLAINREEVIKFLLEGEGIPSYPAGVFPFAADVDFKALPQPKYDVEQAKKLLSEAGYASGFSLDLYAFPMPGAAWLPRMAEAVAGYWDKIGVKAKIIPIDFAVFRPRYTAFPQHPSIQAQASMFRWPPFWIPTVFFRTWFHSKDLVHTMNSAEVDELVDKVPLEVDATKRKEMTTRAALLTYESYVAPPIAYTNLLYGVGPRIKSMQTISGWAHGSLVWETIVKAR